MSKAQHQSKHSSHLSRPNNIPPLSTIHPFLNHDTSFFNKIFQRNNEVKQMAGKNYSKITERLPNVSSNIETIFSSDERLITAKQYVNHYRNTKSSPFTRPFVFSKGNVSFRAMKEQITNQLNQKSSTARSIVKDDQQQQQQPLNTLNHSMHNYLDEEITESLPKENKYTLKDSIDNLMFANSSKNKNKITPTNDRYTVDNYDDININIDINKSHQSNILNSPPHRRSFNNVGNLTVSPGDIACNEFLMKRSGLKDVCLTQRASRSSHSNGSSCRCKSNGCTTNQLTRSVEIERGHKDGHKGNYCINIFPLSMSVHLKMKQNEFHKKKYFNRESSHRDGKNSSNANMDLSYIYNNTNNSKMYSRDVSVDNEDDIVNFKTSINNAHMKNELIRGDADDNEAMMVNPFGKSVEESDKERMRSKQKIKVIRKYKKKRNDDDDDYENNDVDDNERRSNCEEIINFEFKDENAEKDNEDEGLYGNKDKEIRISQLIEDKKEDNDTNEYDKVDDDYGKLSKDIRNEKTLQQKEMNPFMRSQRFKHTKPQNDIVDVKDEIDLNEETIRRSGNDKDDNDNECHVKDVFNNNTHAVRQDDDIIEDVIDDNDINVNKDYSGEDMEKINEKESVEEVESEHIQDKENKEDNIDNSISNEEQQQHSIEHPITNSDNKEQELIQLTPQSTPKPKSQHSSSKTTKQPPSTESHSNNKQFPSQELPITSNSVFFKETTPTQNLPKDTSSYKNETSTHPKSQFIPPETIITLDTPFTSLTPQLHSNNLTTEINEKLNSLLNALNTYDTGVFVFNIQNGQIANEQRYQNVNELYNALRNEHYNDLQIKQNSFDLFCKVNKGKHDEHVVTKVNDFSLIEEEEQQQQNKVSHVEGNVNKVMKLNTICSLIHFTYEPSSYVRDLNLKTFTPRLFQSHSDKKPTHVRTYSNPVMDNKALHFFDSDIHAVANEIAYKEVSKRKQSKQLSDRCAMDSVKQEVNVHSFNMNNMKVSCNEVNISQMAIKKENHNECQSLEGFDIKQDKVFRDVSVASNEVNVREISKEKRLKQGKGVKKTNVVLNEITFDIRVNDNGKEKVFKNLNMVSSEVNVEQVCKRNTNDSIYLNKVCKNMDVVSKEVNFKYVSNLKQKNNTLQEKVFKDIQIVSKEVNVNEFSNNKRKIRSHKETTVQIVSKEVDVKEISNNKCNIHQEKVFKDMLIVSKETELEQISQSKHNNTQHKEFKDVQIVSNEVNMNQISQTKHIIPQEKVFKDVQIASNEININHISQMNKNNDSTKDKPLKYLEIISNEINFNQISTQKDTDNKPQDKSFKDIDIIYNEININHLSSKDNKPTITPPIFEFELIHEFTIKQQRDYKNANIIQQDIINITHPPLYSKQLPSTFQLKSIETLTILPKLNDNHLKENTPTLTQTFSFIHSKAFTNIHIISNQITITHSSSDEKTNSNINQPHSSLSIQPNQTLTFIHENSFSNIDIITNETSFNHIPQYKPPIHLLKQTQPQQFAIHQSKPSKPQHIEITHNELNIQHSQILHHQNNNTPIYQQQSKHSFNIVPIVNTASLPLQHQNNIDNFSFAISGNNSHEYKLLTIKHRHSLKFPPRNKKHVVITQQKLARFIIKPKKKKNLSIPVQSTSFECQHDKLANTLKLLQQEQITSNVNYLPKPTFINNLFMKMCVAFMVITLMSQFYTKNKFKK